MNVAAQEVAQSVRGSFVMRADLPVGSPERAEFFRGLRSTFAEDWKEAENAVARQREAKGDLYFIRAGNAVKIGHTANIVQRLHNMRTNNHQELDCLLLLKGRGHEEAAWHKAFQKNHIRGEWFKWTPTLERAINNARFTNPTLHP